MPVDEQYDVAHEKNKIDDASKYGCFNRTRFEDYYFTLTRVYNDDGTFYMKQEPIEYRMSRECRYDMSTQDVRCTDCVHRGTGEAYADSVRAAAK